MKAPAVERYRVTLRLTSPARFHFLHGAVLRGLLSRGLGEHDLPVGLIPATPESGRTTYQAGEAYHLGLTLVGEDRAVASRLLAGLTRLGESTSDGQRSPTLGGNFEVEAAEPLEPPDLEVEAAALAGGSDGGVHAAGGLGVARPTPPSNKLLATGVPPSNTAACCHVGPVLVFFASASAQHSWPDGVERTERSAGDPPVHLDDPPAETRAWRQAPLPWERRQHWVDNALARFVGRTSESSRRDMSVRTVAPGCMTAVRRNAQMESTAPTAARANDSRRVEF